MSFQNDMSVFFLNKIHSTQYKVNSTHKCIQNIHRYIQIRTNTYICTYNKTEHPKPLQRAKANKLLPKATEIIGHCHAPLVLTNKQQCSIDYIFSNLRGVFVADSIKGGSGKFDLNSV